MAYEKLDKKLNGKPSHFSMMTKISEVQIANNRLRDMILKSQERKNETMIAPNVRELQRQASSLNTI